MAFVTQPLVDGQVPNVQGAIYTVAAGIIAVNVRQIFFYNTSVTAQTITVWLNVSGTLRALKTFTLEQDESCDLLEEPLQLESGDVVEAVTTTASVVDFVVTGVTETE